MHIDDSPISECTRALLFGLPGVGKSTLAANLAIAGRELIWITLDNDIDVLKKLPQEAKDRITLINIPDSAAFPIAAQTLLILFKTYKLNACWAHTKHDCPICKKNAPTKFTKLDLTKLTPNHILIIDTVTQLGRSILSYVTKDQDIEYKPERDDWGSVRKFTEFFATSFQAYTGNLICIAHATEAKLEDGRTKLVTDFGSASMGASLGKAFSHVIYCDVVNKKHIAFSSSTYSNGVLTKSRTDFEIEKLKEPSLIPIFPAWVKPEGYEESKQADVVEEKPQQVAASPATNAVGGLAALRERLKKGT